MGIRHSDGGPENLAVQRSIARLKYLHWLLIFSFGFGAGNSWSQENLFVRDARGKAFRCGEYSRIVSLAPNITEMLFFAEAGRLVKGVTRFCNYPGEALGIEKVGGIYDIDVEKVVSLDPDLVIATKDGNPRQAIDILSEAAIPSFVINPRNIKEIIDTMENVACLAGASVDVFAKIDSLRTDLAAFARRKYEVKSRVLFLVSQSPMVAAGRGTFINEMVLLSGGINVVEHFELSYPRLDVETILSLSPDVIFWVSSMGGEGSADQLEKVEKILGEDRIEIFTVAPDIYTRPGPRLFEGIREISEILSRLGL